jgi:hypothetical protein
VRAGVVMSERRQRVAVSSVGELVGVGEWASCYCCGRSYLAAHMVHFHRHPDEALCVRCVDWLHDCSRPIIRRLRPIWQLPAFARTWLTSALPAADSPAGGEKAGNGSQLPPPQAGQTVSCQAGRLSTGR